MIKIYLNKSEFKNQRIPFSLFTDNGEICRTKYSWLPSDLNQDIQKYF